MGLVHCRYLLVMSSPGMNRSLGKPSPRPASAAGDDRKALASSLPRSDPRRGPAIIPIKEGLRRWIVDTLQKGPELDSDKDMSPGEALGLIEYLKANPLDVKRIRFGCQPMSNLLAAKIGEYLMLANCKLNEVVLLGIFNVTAFDTMNLQVEQITHDGLVPLLRGITSNHTLRKLVLIDHKISGSGNFIIDSYSLLEPKLFICRSCENCRGLTPQQYSYASQSEPQLVEQAFCWTRSPCKSPRA